MNRRRLLVIQIFLMLVFCRSLVAAEEKEESKSGRPVIEEDLESEHFLSELREQLLPFVLQALNQDNADEETAFPEPPAQLVDGPAGNELEQQREDDPMAALWLDPSAPEEDRVQAFLSTGPGPEEIIVQNRNPSSSSKRPVWAVVGFPDLLNDESFSSVNEEENGNLVDRIGSPPESLRYRSSVNSLTSASPGIHKVSPQVSPRPSFLASRVRGLQNTPQNMPEGMLSKNHFRDVSPTISGFVSGTGHRHSDQELANVPNSLAYRMETGGTPKPKVFPFRNRKTSRRSPGQLSAIQKKLRDDSIKDEPEGGEKGYSQPLFLKADDNWKPLSSPETMQDDVEEAETGQDQVQEESVRILRHLNPVEAARNGHLTPLEGETPGKNIQERFLQNDFRSVQSSYQKEEELQSIQPQSPPFGEVVASIVVTPTFGSTTIRPTIQSSHNAIATQNRPVGAFQSVPSFYQKEEELQSINPQRPPSGEVVASIVVTPNFEGTTVRPTIQIPQNAIARQNRPVGAFPHYRTAAHDGSGGQREVGTQNGVLPPKPDVPSDLWDILTHPHEDVSTTTFVQHSSGINTRQEEALRRYYASQLHRGIVLNQPARINQPQIQFRDTLPRPTRGVQRLRGPSQFPSVRPNLRRPLVRSRNQRPPNSLRRDPEVRSN